MSARSITVTVCLIAVFACAGGPTSDYPINGGEDAGVRGPDDGDEGMFGGTLGGNTGSAMDAAAAAEQDAANQSGSDEPKTCVDAALSDAGVQDASAGDGSADASVGDAAFDVDASDAAPAEDAGDAQIEADADAAQIDADANFPDATGDAELGPADAASDAPYIGPDAAPCVP